VVCFDLGGVLARINRTWQGAAETAGIGTSLDGQAQIPLAGLACFDDFQAGKLALADYFEALAFALGVDVPQARLVHDSILMGPYDGTEEIVRAVKGLGVRTACLSNTNAPHWEILRSEIHFPGIAALDFAMASHEVKMEKPHAEIYRHFESTFGFASEQVVFFDDSAPNVEAAKEVGWHAHWIDHERETAPQIRAALVGEGIVVPAVEE